MLHKYCGVAEEDQDSENTLSLFWKGLRPCRKNNSAARNYVEDFRRQYIRGQMKYQHVFTSSCINDLRNLHFASSDMGYGWEDRFKGLTIFVLAPADDDGSAGALRDKMVSFEDTAHQHTPKDRAEMVALSGPARRVPTTRMTLFTWIDHGVAMLELFFTESCPLVTILKTIRAELQNSAQFYGYDKVNYAALLWKIHVGIRSYFVRGDVYTLKRVVVDINQLNRYQLLDLPPELAKQLGVHPVTPAAGASSSHGDGREPAAKKSKKGSDNGFTRQWAPAIEQLRSKLGASKILRATDIAGDQQSRHRILGQDFVNLVPGEPCFRYFVMGRCNSNPCACSHQLNAKPSPTILQGIQTRLKQRLDHLAQHPNEVGGTTA